MIAQAISETTPIQIGTVCALLGGVGFIGIFIFRTLSALKDSVNQLGNKLELRMQALELKQDGNLKRHDFERWLAQLSRENPEIHIPMDVP